MAAPLSKLRNIREIWSKSTHDWKRHANRTPKNFRKSESRSSGYRQMLAGRCKQADRTILVQYSDKNNLCDVLSTVQHNFGEIKTGFNFPDQGGKNFVVVELDQDDRFSGPALNHVMHFANLQKGKKLGKLKKNVVSEYNAKTFPLDTLSTCENVSDQTMTLYKEVQMPEAMIRLHFFVGMLIRKTIRKRFRTAETLFFGSSSCGVAMAGKSDLDMVVFCDNISENKLLGQLAGLLRREHSLFDEVFHIPGARVPIVKFNQIHTQMSCDISCNTLTGVLMAETLYTLNMYEPLFFPLVMALKYWGREHLVTASGQHRLFTNHMLTMLVMAYLQQLRLLPPLKALYANTDFSRKDLSVQALFNRIVLKPPAKNIRKLFDEKEQNLGELLLGFFQFYRDFSFVDYVIDLHFGKVIKMPHRYHICVMNPHEDGHNMCKNVEEIQVDRFKRLCKDSAHVLGLNQRKTTNGDPWGLIPVLSLQTFRKKKGTSKFDFDLVYKPDSVEIEEVIITSDADNSDVTIEDSRHSSQRDLMFKIAKTRAGLCNEEIQVKSNCDTVISSEETANDLSKNKFDNNSDQQPSKVSIDTKSTYKVNVNRSKNAKQKYLKVKKTDRIKV